MGYGISREVYISRIQRVTALLKGPELADYPSLTKLLETRTTRPKKPYREYLRELLTHIAATVELGKPTEIINNGDAVAAYGLTISRHFLAKLWGCSYEVAGNVSMILACTLCINRRTSRDEEALQKLKARSQETESEYPHTIYAYWVDGWTQAQLEAKEKHAQAWIDAGKKRGGLSKHEAISIWGQTVADAISQDGRQKKSKRREQEQRLARAYEAVINTKEAGAPVTRTELEEYLKKSVPRKEKGQPTIERETADRWKHYQEAERPFEEQWTHKPPRTKASIRAEIRERREQEYKKRCRSCFNCWWREGKTQLLVDYGLEYRPLSGPEKAYYGIAGKNVWGLVPRS